MEFVYCGGRQLRQRTTDRSLFFPERGVCKREGGGVSQFLIARTGWRSKNIFLNFGRIIYSQGTGVM